MLKTIEYPEELNFTKTFGLADIITRFPWIDVRSYGAVGDGTTDDSLAFSKAMTACYSTGALLVVPPATYKVATMSSYSITGNIRILGIGNAILNGNSVSTSRFEVGANLDFLEISGLRFTQYGDAILYCATSGRIINNLTFHNNEVDNSGEGITLTSCIVNSAIVKNNRFHDLSSSGDVCAIKLGGNNYTTEADMCKYIVTDNHFEDLVSSGSSTEVHAVLLYGSQAIVSNNVIDTVSNSNLVNCEGIYTKSKYSTITGNTLIDAGSTHGSISSKGPGQAVITGNNISATTGKTVGIYVDAAKDTIVANNYIEGLGDYAITISQTTEENVMVTGNVVRGHRGRYAFYLYIADVATGGKIGLTVKNNCIYDLLASEGTITTAVGIHLSTWTNAISTTDVSICDNFIYENDNSSATTTIVGIDIDVNAGTTLSRLTLNNNKAYINHSTADEIGIRLDIDGTLTTLFCTGNDCAGVPSKPFYVLDPTNITDFEIGNNFFWGPIIETGTTNITSLEFYHTDGRFTNNGANGNGDGFSLPVAQAGLKYTFVAVDNFDLYVRPDGTDTIRGGGAGKYLNLDTQGDSVVLECFIANEWEIVGGYGTYAYEA